MGPPHAYLPKSSYDAILRAGHEPSELVRTAVAQALAALEQDPAPVDPEPPGDDQRSDSSPEPTEPTRRMAGPPSHEPEPTTDALREESDNTADSLDLSEFVTVHPMGPTSAVRATLERIRFLLQFSQGSLPEDFIPPGRKGFELFWDSPPRHKIQDSLTRNRVEPVTSPQGFEPPERPSPRLGIELSNP